MRCFKHITPDVEEENHVTHVSKKVIVHLLLFIVPVSILLLFFAGQHPRQVLQPSVHEAAAMCEVQALQC